MGVLNLTPDSFSDGGKFNSLSRAIKRFKQMEKEGADIIDIGGESTGPGSKNISLDEELSRVIPFIQKIRPLTALPISIDTYKAKVADQALKAGANIINDVTALRSDPKMAKIAAQHKCPIILMYSKDNSPRTTVKKKKYNDVMQTIETFFKERLKYANSQGITKSQIILDPGMGQFISAIPHYSYEIIARLKKLQSFKCQIALGISRKSFLGGQISSRLSPALLASTIAYLNGASIIRTHDIAQTKNFFKSLK